MEKPLTLASYLASERAADDYCNEVVDGSGRLQYLDSRVSVSGLRRDETFFAHVTDQLLLEQSERFHNGS